MPALTDLESGAIFAEDLVQVEISMDAELNKNPFDAKQDLSKIALQTAPENANFNHIITRPFGIMNGQSVLVGPFASVNGVTTELITGIQKNSVIAATIFGNSAYSDSKIVAVNETYVVSAPHQLEVVAFAVMPSDDLSVVPLFDLEWSSSNTSVVTITNISSERIELSLTDDQLPATATDVTITATDESGEEISFVLHLDASLAHFPEDAQLAQIDDPASADPTITTLSNTSLKLYAANKDELTARSYGVWSNGQKAIYATTEWTSSNPQLIVPVVTDGVMSFSLPAGIPSEATEVVLSASDETGNVLELVIEVLPAAPTFPTGAKWVRIYEYLMFLGDPLYKELPEKTVITDFTQLQRFAVAISTGVDDELYRGATITSSHPDLIRISPEQGDGFYQFGIDALPDVATDVTITAVDESGGELSFVLQLDKNGVIPFPQSAAIADVINAPYNPVELLTSPIIINSASNLPNDLFVTSSIDPGYEIHPTTTWSSSHPAILSVTTYNTPAGKLATLELAGDALPAEAVDVTITATDGQGGELTLTLRLDAEAKIPFSSDAFMARLTQDPLAGTVPELHAMLAEIAIRSADDFNTTFSYIAMVESLDFFALTTGEAVPVDAWSSSHPDLVDIEFQNHPTNSVVSLRYASQDFPAEPTVVTITASDGVGGEVSVKIRLDASLNAIFPEEAFIIMDTDSELVQVTEPLVIENISDNYSLYVSASLSYMEYPYEVKEWSVSHPDLVALEEIKPEGGISVSAKTLPATQTDVTLTATDAEGATRTAILRLLPPKL